METSLRRHSHDSRGRYAEAYTPVAEGSWFEIKTDTGRIRVMVQQGQVLVDAPDGRLLLQPLSGNMASLRTEPWVKRDA